MQLPIKYSTSHWKKRAMARRQYAAEQNHMCLYCKLPLSEDPPHDKDINWDLFPPNFLKYPIHLHHSHKDDLTIGAVHAYCNAVLWQYEGE